MLLVNSDEMNTIVARSSSRPSIVPGGSAANTIFGLAKLGIKTAFLGKTGQDDDGEFYIVRYSEMGGDISHFKKTASAHTGRCLSMVTPDSERTMRTDLGAAASMTAGDIENENFSDISHVHTEGYLLFNEPYLMKGLELSKRYSCTVSLDLSSFEVVNFAKQKLPGILREYVDIVLANEDEARSFSGSENPEEALNSLSALCSTAVVKLGKNGSLIRRDGVTVRVPANRVENAVDTTGAGDLWASGFLFGMLNGQTVEDAGRHASLLGAEVVKIIGASIPENRWNEIRKKIK